jgi:hypothetical protein
MSVPCRFFIAIFLAGLWASLGSAQAIAGYNAAADFSPTSNPNGVWSYGYSTTLGGAFNLYTTSGIFPNPNGTPTGLDSWYKNISLDDPAVIHNGTNAPILVDGSALYNPGQLGLHPGPDGEDSIVRFTASATTTYSLTSSFSGLDEVGTTTDVHVLVNGVSIYNNLINGFGAVDNFTSSLTLNAGDHVDFVVGYGSNGTFYYDSTGLSATFSPSSTVPEPSSVVLVAIAGVVLAGTQLRRRRAANRQTPEVGATGSSVTSS